MFLNTTNANGRSHSHFVTAFIIFTENPLVNVYLSSKGLFLLPFAAPLKVSDGVPARETGEGSVSFSEVRRNLSRKMGKRGGEIWPPSRISSGHGGEVLQEFTVVCAIRPFFPSFCFSSCHRGNKKRFLLLSLAPERRRKLSAGPQTATCFSILPSYTYPASQTCCCS